MRNGPLEKNGALPAGITGGQLPIQLSLSKGR